MGAYRAYRMMKDPDVRVKATDTDGSVYELFLRGSQERIDEVSFISDADDATVEAVDTFIDSLKGKTVREGQLL